MLNFLFSVVSACSNKLQALASRAKLQCMVCPTISIVINKLVDKKRRRTMLQIRNSFMPLINFHNNIPLPHMLYFQAGISSFNTLLVLINYGDSYYILFWRSRYYREIFLRHLHLRCQPKITVMLVERK